jgi:hypothetical protein
MQSLEELNRATAEVGVVNPGWNATDVVKSFVLNVAQFVEEGVAAVLVFFPDIFTTGLPAKYYLHARMAKLSRAWAVNNANEKYNIFIPFSDLFNHHEPSDIRIAISFDQENNVNEKSDVAFIEVILTQNVENGTEVFNCT